MFYCNDSLWIGSHRYAHREYRLARAERDALIAAERRVLDEQEERWRAYHVLREVMNESDSAELRRRAAVLAVRCLRLIHRERFGREAEIRAADVELTRWLRQNGA